MRRSFVLMVPFIPAALFLAGCEDGPNQTYAPAPPGALFNNGDTPAAVDNATQPLVTGAGATSKTEICGGAELQQQWSKMVNQPIVPPYRMAGADMRGPVDANGNPTWTFLTLEQAELGPLNPVTNDPGSSDPPTRLCQPGQILGPGGNGSDVGGSTVVGWGNNNEFTMEWAIPTHKAYVLNLNPGYIGKMTWQFKCTAGECADPADVGMHTYIWQLGQTIKKDGKPFIVDWPGGYGSVAAITKRETDEIYRGLVSYFQPDIYDHPAVGVNCSDSGTCLITPTGNTGVNPIIGFRPVSMYFNLGVLSQPQPSASTVQSAYFFNIKYAPYSPAHTTLKIFDQQGPIAQINPGDNGKHCTLALGNTFGDMLSNCIEVFKDQSLNDATKLKILGNLTHDDQSFTFSVVGDNLNYLPPELFLGGSRQFDVIHDNEQPAATAIADDFQFDVRAFGPLTNDTRNYTPDGTTTIYKKDYHGSGAVWQEWGRLVQTDLAAKYHALHPSVPLRSVHDPACYMPANQDPTTIYQWRPAAGCTGFEGMLTAAYPNHWGHNTTNPALDGTPVDLANPNTKDTKNVWDTNGAYGAYTLGFKPGGQFSMFCDDPATKNLCGAGGDILGVYNGLLDGAFSRVLSFLGNGNILQVPTEGRDYRYYYRQFFIAMAKYFSTPAAGDLGQSSCTPTGSATTVPCAVSASGSPIYGTNPQAVRDFGVSVTLDTDNLFFDAYGGNAAKAEYVDMANADKTHNPLDFEMKMLLLGTNLQSMIFSRKLDREEQAIFNSMENADAKAAGQASWAFQRDTNNNVVYDVYCSDGSTASATGVCATGTARKFPRKNASVFLSNLAGSTAITTGDGFGANWASVSCAADADCTGAGAGTKCNTANKTCIVDAAQKDACDPSQPLTYTAYYCATHTDAGCQATSNSPPLNDDGSLVLRENGKPLLADYCGIFNPTAFTLTGPGTASPIKIVNTQPLITEATVEIPSFANPYDLTTKSTPIQAFVPWQPQQEGSGFPVMASGESDVFVETASLNFAGQVITPVMDYLPIQVTPKSGAPYTAASILAYETEDFLGDLFMCYDTVTAANRAGTGRPGDILAVHMYTSGQSILDWVAAHPGTADNCGILIRYSPYNNYVDFIQSSVNGIRLGIDQASGYGRVVEATVFAPGQGTPPPP